MGKSWFSSSNTTQADADAQSVAGGSIAARDDGQVLVGNNFGGEYTIRHGGTLTVNGAAGAEALAEKFSETLASINDSSNLLVENALGKVAELSESKQTEGVSSLGRLGLWGLGILASIAIAWIFRKK